jgi:type IV pilus assembly protein PilN
MVRINLLPVRVSKKKEAGKQQLVLFAVLLAVGLVGNYLWSSARASDLREREAKVARTREDIAKLERIIGEVKNLKEQQAALQKKLDVLEKLKAGRSGPVRMLDELASTLPRQLWLTKIEEKGTNLNLIGVAVSIEDVSEFLTKLKQSRYFSGVELKKTTASAATKGGERLVTFEIVTGVSYDPTRSPAAPTAGKG